MFKNKLPVSHIRAMNVCFDITFDGIFFVSTIKNKGEKFPR